MQIQGFFALLRMTKREEVLRNDSNCEDNSRSPSGMTTRKKRTNANTGILRFAQNDGGKGGVEGQQQMQRQQQTPFGADNKKTKATATANVEF
jgi:hypothetical protein